ncbi:hypothetical protein SAMN05428954_4886 [Streptomyces sp. 2112.3]|uniref:hypothetical protein n=1 Tax=Streptomyces sp. 2112.3 TaxID=1881023 RepID=UPI000895BFE7|nr:hypothetical protein [Streptomyces sp. 2112.3]SEE97135.1 hypothetical protein SAMN05428954_4886 [Streptomyces sp. 2112.3]
MPQDLTVEKLIASASLYARQAIPGPGVNSLPHEEAFTAFSGIVLERLAKAALMRRSPALIVELGSKNGAWETLLHLTGIAAHHSLRTVGLKVALDRLRTPPLSVPLGVSPRDLEDLVKLRNESAHAIGVLEDASLIGKFAIVVDHILADLQNDRESFWAECLSAVDYVKGGSEAKARKQVWDSIKAARLEYKKGHAGETEEDEEYYYRWSAKRVSSFPKWQLRDCPACGNVGRMTGYLAVRELEAPADEVDEVFGVVEFHPQTFKCVSCPLELGNEVDLAYGMDNTPNFTSLTLDEFERIESQVCETDVLG